MDVLEFTVFSWALEIKMLAQHAGIYSIFMGGGAHCKPLLAHFCTSGPSHWTTPTGTRVKQVRFGNWRSCSRMEHFWATFSVKKFRPLLCEQLSVIFLKLQYEQKLDDDNDRRGQSETLWGWKLKTKRQAESHAAWILNFRGDAVTVRSETPLSARPCDTATLLAWATWCREKLILSIWYFLRFSAQTLGIWAWHPAPKNVKLRTVPKPVCQFASFSENVARNNLKSRLFGQEMLRSAVGTPICQIVFARLPPQRWHHS